MKNFKSTLIYFSTQAPYPVRKTLRRIYGFTPKSIRLGKTFLNTYNFLMKSQWWDKDQLEEYQLQKLSNLLTDCYENVPYYTKVFDEKGLKPKDIQDLKDLKELPYLTKDIFRANKSKLINKKFNTKFLPKITTSGSSGKPLQFFSNSIIEEKELAFVYHQWARVGFTLNDKRIELRGKITNKIDYDPIFKVLRLPPIINDQIAKEFINQIKKSGAKFIHGYPSTISHFAFMIKKQGINLPFQLKAVLFASEAVYEWEKEIVQEIFNCRVYSFYGMAERVVMAGECEDSDYYYCVPQYGITEINKDTKEIIGTGFLNNITPFIRYKTNDIASEVIKNCNECSRDYYPIIKNIEGRLGDYLITKNGFIGPAILTHYFKNFNNIKNTQIVQETEKEIVLNVEPLFQNLEYEEEIKELILNLKKILGSEMNIIINEVDEIPRSKSGKFRWIISKPCKNLLENGF